MSMLYTTLHALKAEIRPGKPAPHTPLPPEASHLIDPSYVHDGGAGTLFEDAEKGLRCPIKGCGKWSHNLSLHLRYTHPTVDPNEFRRVVGAPAGAALVSAKGRKSYRDAARRRQNAPPLARIATSASRSKGGRARAAAARTMMGRNKILGCPEQMALRYRELEHKLGRTPRSADDLSLRAAARIAYGTWNSFVANLGAVEKNRRYSQDELCSAFAGFFAVHGRMPSSAEANKPTRLPLFPSVATTLKVLGMSSWPMAMSHVAFVLGVVCPVYSPKQDRKAVA